MEQVHALGGAFLRQTGTALSAFITQCESFRRAESGTMTFMAVALSLMMMIFGGIGIDMMYAELQRTKIQNTLDRAVLAAADLDNELDAQGVVEDYMARMGLSDALVSVDVDEGLNYRTVTADGYRTMPSNFMQLIGIDNMQAGGHAQAMERINKVEVSMVLDISGSMDDGDKMAELQTAASDFVDTLLDDSTEDLVSISLVPYSEHVNAGPEILSYLNVNYRHDDSYCLEMPNSVFSSPALDFSLTYDQMQHFQWNYSGSNSLSDTICPRYAYEQIRPWSQDANALKTQIGQLQPRAGTSIFMGMKWASALLDPSTQRIASGMIANGTVDAVFEGRPVAYSDTDVLKTIVLMTDGQHDRSFRIQNWAYDDENEVEHWSRYNLWHYLNHYVNYWNRDSFYYQKYDAATGDALLSSICTAAKRQGVLIWTIGFEVSNHGANVMERCASSPAHFFRVEGVEISEAFSTIAQTLNQLRLTQ
ncbi:TadE/TadG family type IV pilus assembly protein [Salipiger bermudensis]|uniref:TadE/TadG family type IV pilus assembly protein n=1 Tax=Salipiger bermudensis TaxID=344736 RepID=UPI001CD70046|nr:TadE/TadG family type IV pilus assembly protein [Salipiger bermudensis]MCA0964285.1 pilus assembly protein [Salipiger bermudensis]